MQEVGEDVRTAGVQQRTMIGGRVLGSTETGSSIGVAACLRVGSFALRLLYVTHQSQTLVRQTLPLWKKPFAPPDTNTHTHAYTNNCLRHICYHLSMSSACLVSSRLDKTFYRTAILMIDFLCKNLKKRIQPHGYRAPPSAVPLGRGEPRDHR